VKAKYFSEITVKLH